MKKAWALLVAAAMAVIYFGSEGPPADDDFVARSRTRGLL